MYLVPLSTFQKRVQKRIEQLQYKDTLEAKFLQEITEDIKDDKKEYEKRILFAVKHAQNNINTLTSIENYWGSWFETSMWDVRLIQDAYLDEYDYKRIVE